MQIIKGKIKEPLRIIVYGTAAVGKSTFASRAPKPIFISCENGTGELDIDRLPEATTFQQVLTHLRWIIDDPNHSYETLVIDTLDQVELFSHTQILTTANKKSMADFDYGKGYLAAFDHFRTLVSLLDEVWQKRKMNIILLAHDKMTVHNDPSVAAEGWERFELKLRADVTKLLVNWAQDVLFASYEMFASKEKKSDKMRGRSTGNRIMYTESTAQYQAKNRHGLEHKMPLSWDEFYAAARNVDINKEMQKIRDEAAVLLPSVPEERREKARAFIYDMSRTLPELRESLNLVKTLVPEAAPADADASVSAV